MEKNLLTVKRKICLPQVEKSVYRGKKKLFTLPGKFCLTFRMLVGVYYVGALLDKVHRILNK